MTIMKHSTPAGNTIIIESGDDSQYVVLNAENLGSSNLEVDGSVTPVDFTIDSHATKLIVLKELRFFFMGNTIQFDQFGSIKTLTNGVEVSWKSQDITTTLEPIKKTEDFKNCFSFGTGDIFWIDQQPGRDQIFARLMFPSGLILDPDGTHGSDDYVQVKIQDDLVDSRVRQFGFKGFGFLRNI